MPHRWMGYVARLFALCTPSPFTILFNSIVSVVYVHNTLTREEDATERAIFAASDSLLAPATLTYTLAKNYLNQH